MPPTAASLLERLRETIELLESIAADRSVLEHVPEEDRTRLLRAVANVYDPDRIERRRLRKLNARERRAARVQADEAVLYETLRSLAPGAPVPMAGRRRTTWSLVWPVAR